ncbi:MAG: D-alanine--D-alanine ligase family protein [Anaerolineae bacterium]
MSVRRRVAVLSGGVSGEHEVSINSGRAVSEALTQAGYDVVPVRIDKAGTWRLTAGGQQVYLEQGGQLPAVVAGPERGTERVDVVFPVLHGTMGEDGTVQGLLELAEVPYVGSGVLGSAVGMDKIVMKRLFQQAGLAVLDYVAATRRQVEQVPAALMARVEAQCGYPCFVKPANLGSSVGISKVHDRDELLPALRMAAGFDRRIVVERGIDAREIEVGVLGNDDPEASLPGEVIPGREFYDYVAKYGDAGSETLIPAPIGESVTRLAREMAVRAFVELDLAGMARVDFLLDRGSERLYINEVNTIPGFTEISMYSKLWEASGVSFPQLVTRLVDLALERAGDRRRSLQAARQTLIES